MQLYMSWYIISFFGFTFLNIFIFSSTLVLTFSYRRNLYTFYQINRWIGIFSKISCSIFILFYFVLLSSAWRYFYFSNSCIKPVELPMDLCDYIEYLTAHATVFRCLNGFFHALTFFAKYIHWSALSTRQFISHPHMIMQYVRVTNDIWTMFVFINTPYYTPNVGLEAVLLTMGPSSLIFMTQ